MVKKDNFKEREAEKYEKPIASREFILEHLAERGEPATRQQLTAELNLETPDEIEALRRRLLAMVRDGQLHQNRRGTYGLVEKMQMITGLVIGHRDGFGFVVPDEGGDDLFLSPRQMRVVFHGDKVLVRVTGIDHRGRREAIIIEVLESNTHQVVGKFITESDTSFLQPVNHRINQEIMIPPKAVGDAKNGQMVVVEITSQPTASLRPFGKVVEVLGDHMAPGMEIDVAIRSYDLPHVWPDGVLEEADKYPIDIPESAFKDRLDLRKLPFVTIDGADAKDFDDAVYCERAGKGWTLYVAIADVSHYVLPDTLLDKEALNRGNSVYFPEQVIPMLPEILSNGLCSLKPKVNRLTQVCKMSITAAGKISQATFHEAVIFSHARLTYDQVHLMIEKNDEPLRQQFADVVPHLADLYVLYDILHRARETRGAIDFDMPETKILFGADRKIEKIVPSQRNNAHRLIEECMLSANISAAKFLLKHEQPALYRIHEGPNDTKLTDLRRFLGELGLKLPGRKIPRPLDYSTLLKQVGDRPDVKTIQMMLLRSLSQAVYSPENKGHFGLAFDSYAHFTSPIRRYPDLLVHRAIRRVLRKDKHPQSLSVLELQGEHCSKTERRADEATREVIDWLKCEFMLDKVGEVFAGRITNVTSFGLFVELKDFYVEGLIHISNLPNDYYQFDPTKQVLFGERGGMRYKLSDTIEIRVARVDLDQRQIDFVLAAEDIVTKREPKKKKSKKRRQK